MYDVSVIIPVINDRRIKRAIDSVISQKGSGEISIQIIVVDDSYDETSNLLFQYQEHIEITSTPGGANGMYAARNQGLTLATGDFVAFLGADDVYAYENALSDLVKLYDNNFKRSDPGFSHGWVTMVDSSGDTWDLPRKPTLELYNNGWIIPDLATIWTKEVFHRYGNYLEYFYVAGDHEFFRRVVLLYNVQHICLDRTVTLMETGGRSSKNSLVREIVAAYELWLCMRAQPKVHSPFYGHNTFSIAILCMEIKERIFKHINTVISKIRKCF